jgi:hypothetical protein
MIDQIPTRMGMEAMDHHRSAMRGGDDTVTYSQTGEIVIPVEVQRRFPGLAEAAMAAIQQSGANPSRFVVGSPDGSYNPQTGAQEFFLTGLLDWASSSRLGQSLASGVGSAALAKLSGASTKQALAAGAGSSLGYAAGDFIGDFMKPTATPATPTTPAAPAQPRAPSANIREALSNFGGSFSSAGLTGASLGGLAGASLVPNKVNIPALNFDPNAPSSISNMPAPLPFIPSADRPNVSATLPQNLPVAPMTPRGMPSGVNYLQPVTDRNTGRTSFADVGQDGGTFSRAVNQMDSQRRRSGFGNIMFV